MRIGDICKRTQYLGYYLKKMEYVKLMKFLEYSSRKSGRSQFSLIMDALGSVYKYNIGIIDYFLFRFFELSDSEREKWAGTGYRYEYDLVMNPRTKRHLLENKLAFYRTYKSFIKHQICTIQEIRAGSPEAFKVIKNPTGKIVVKNSLGQCGQSVEVLKIKDFSFPSLLEYMKKRKLDMAEEFIVQHEDLNALSPSGLNTVRVITQLDKNDEVAFLGARIRISINSHVDNLAQGNMAAPVDLETGVVSGPAVYSDITKEREAVHPVTGVRIPGFKIPLWNEVISMVKNAAAYNKENRSIGWDIAVTDQYPDIIEGNHNWCKILWQIPENRGMKEVLEKYR